MYAETLAFAFAAEHKIAIANLSAIAHEESLLCVGGSSNGINWLAGHLLNARGRRIAANIGAAGPFLTEALEKLRESASNKPRHSSPNRECQ